MCMYLYLSIKQLTIKVLLQNKGAESTAELGKNWSQQPWVECKKSACFIPSSVSS